MLRLRRAAWLGWLLAGALGARLGYLLLSHRLLSPEVWEYEEMARSILRGDGYRYVHYGLSYVAYSSSVLYPFLAAAVYAVTGFSQPALVMVQVLLSVLTVWVVVAVAWRLVGRVPAAISGLILAFHGPTLVYTGKLHPLVLDTLLTSACLFATLLLDRRRGWSTSVFFGLAFGLGILTRPTLALFLPLALGWLVWRGGLRERWPQLTLGLVLAVAVLVPWTVRNDLLLGRPIFVSSMSTENLWLGNNPHATGGALTPSGDWVTLAVPSDFGEALRAASETQRYDLYERAALSYIRADPAGFVRRTAQKFLYFWWFSPQTGIEYDRRWTEAYRAEWAVLLPLAALGVWHTLRAGQRRRLSVLMLLLLAEVSITQSVFYVEGRHRWVIEPLVLIYAAQGLCLLCGVLQAVATQRRLISARSLRIKATTD